MVQAIPQGWLLIGYSCVYCMVNLLGVQMSCIIDQCEMRLLMLVHDDDGDGGGEGDGEIGFCHLD